MKNGHRRLSNNYLFNGEIMESAWAISANDQGRLRNAIEQNTTWYHRAMDASPIEDNHLHDLSRLLNSRKQAHN